MSGFDYFKLALSKYAQFEGRSRRKEYWYFYLFQLLITYGVMAVEYLVFDTAFFSGLLSLAFLVPSLAVGVRRLHDIGKSGWNILWILLPLIGFILLLVWFCTDSEPGSNRWGHNPKEIGGEVVDHLIDDDTLV